VILNETQDRPKMKKTIILGFDGASPDLIKQWAEQNELPNFKKIIDTGIHGPLKTTIPPLTPCAWSSLITGKNPGKHGIYDFFYLNEQHEMKIHSSVNRSSKDLWEYLTENNLKSFVFNVPFTYPPKNINGIMVSDFTTPSTEADFTHPPELKKEILEKHPDFKISEKSKFSENEKSKKEFQDEAFRLADLRYKVAIDLMKNQDFDFAMIVFMLIDHMQHWYWKYMDKNHPKYQKDSSLEDTIKNAYKKMDSFLGKFIQTFPNHNIIIVSDHGGGPYYKDVTINKWLMDENYLFLKKNRSFQKSIANKIGTNKLISKGLNLGLWKFISSSPRIKELIQKKLLLTYNDIDWDKTLAYSYGYYGPIYINKDIVKSVEELQKLKNEIKEKLKKIKDPITKEVLIKQIWDREELYSGEKSDILPDIVINMGDFSYACSSTFPFSSNEIFSEPKTFKTGDHTQYGIFMACGSDIKKGKEIKNATIYDTAPTILHIFNIPIPKDMDGKVLREIFKEDSEFVKPITYQSNEGKYDKKEKAMQQKALTDKDEEKTKERLRDLGYL